MLIEKPLKNGDTVTVKLTSGEELLATYKGFNDEKNLVVEKPATISATPDGKMGIIPWMMTSTKEEVILNSNTVVTFAPTVDEIAKSYKQSVTNIKLV